MKKLEIDEGWEQRKRITRLARVSVRATKGVGSRYTKRSHKEKVSDVLDPARIKYPKQVFP